MLEGKNIHLSPIDGKRLCSFSRKLCKQRRLNGYGFCIRHILEDTTSPFKQCKFRIKSNGEQCFNAVPINADRVYCNSHLQVLGLLPKTVPKKNPNTKDATENIQLAKKNKSGEHIEKQVPENNLNSLNDSTNTSKITMKKKKKTLPTHEDARNDQALKTAAQKRRIIQSRRLKIENWKQNTHEREIEEFKSAILNKTSIDCSQSYYKIIGDSNLENDFTSATSYQTTFLTASERVHHNALKMDSASYQEHKILSKLRHQYGQLQMTLNMKKCSGHLSYSVLSQLVSAARQNVIETSNILIVSKSRLEEPCKLHKCQERVLNHTIPCCIISGSVKCTNIALPFMKYCRDHVIEDIDQHLFAKPFKEQSAKRTLGLSFLKINDRTVHNPSKRVIPLKKTNRKQGKHKSSNRKNSKLKKIENEKRAKNLLRAQIERKTLVNNGAFQTSSANVKIPNQLYESVGNNKTIAEMPVVSSSSSDAESDSESSICDEDTESDHLLTPEEAFHLPPGSLSKFPREVDEDDALSAIRQPRDLDDDDDDLLRCSNNFGLEPLSRDLSSPTLNQLSSNDFESTFNMLLSPSKASSVSSETSTIVSSMISTFSSIETGTVNEVASMQQHQQMREFTGIPHSSTTSLKITPVTANTRTINFSIPKKVSKVTTSSYPNEKLQNFQNYYGSANPPKNGYHELNPYTQQTSQLLHSSHTDVQASRDETSVQNINSRNKRCWTDTLLLQQPFQRESNLFEGIHTDLDAPLEKINPDIFFSSVFPVATSTSNI